jgi:hypothetical protein
MTYIPTIYTARLANDAVTSAKILDAEIVNADVSASAAIAYSKLALSNSIVNADIAAGAAIVYSKLNLANSIVSADIVNGTIVAADTTISLAQLAAQTASAGDITASSQKITNVADGVNPADAVNYSQLTAISNGIVDWKSSVQVATTANVTLSGEQTIDGVLTSASRILVKNQSTGSQNGIYVTAAGAWTRSTDADVSAEVTSGMAVSVTEGTLYDNTLWLLSTNDPITLNTTSLTFIQLPSLNDLLAGAGLTKTGSTVDVGAGTGITVNANDVQIDTAVVPRLGVANAFTGANTYAGTSTFNNLVTIGSSSHLRLNRIAHAGTGVNVLLVPSGGGQHIIGVTTAGGSTEIRLPASHTEGHWYDIVDEGGVAATSNITITTADADTINGAADYVIASNREAISVYSDGTNWFIR